MLAYTTDLLVHKFEQLEALDFGLRLSDSNINYT